MAEEPTVEEPIEEPAPRPSWEPDVTWEPQPLNDPEVIPVQKLEREPEPQPAPTATPDPVEQFDPPSERIREQNPEPPVAAPRLRVTLAGPQGVRAGQDVRLTVTVTNEGRGPAEAVTIACPVPAGLRHPEGKLVRCMLGELSPGEVRTASFIARAVTPGPAGPELTVTARGGLVAAVTTPLTVRPASCP